MTISPQALQLMNSPPSFNTPMTSGADASLSQSVSNSTGSFTFGGASITTPLIIGAVILGAIYFLRR